MATKKQPARKATAKSSTSPATKELERDIKGNILKVVNIEKTQKENRSLGEKMSEAIALFCGSMVFVYVHVIWFGGWIIFNSVLPNYQFDPFPYTFLTLIVSLEAIFLSTFILISQNHETQITERRNHLDLQVNMLAEQENTKILELLEAIAKKVGVPGKDKAATKALLADMEPEKMIEHIMAATGEDPKEIKPPRK